MNQILVSVIIPSYNSRRWVSDAIESILNQSYPHCEIIVVDDGSSDGTGEFLCCKYGDKITYIYQDNCGLSGARNTGLVHAHGDYIQFLDADDLIHPDKIRLQVELMRSSDSPSVSYSDYYHCDIDDLNHIFPEYYRSPHLLSNSSLEDLALRWETKLSIPVHCFLFDAGIFRDHGIRFDESLPNHEDWDCWMQIFALNPKVLFLDQKLAIYRVRSDGACKNYRMMRYGFLQAIKKQKKLFACNPKMKKLLDEKEREIRFHYRYFGLMGRIITYVPQNLKALFALLIPQRIQRMFD